MILCHFVPDDEPATPIAVVEAPEASRVGAVAVAFVAFLVVLVLVLDLPCLAIDKKIKPKNKP